MHRRHTLGQVLPTQLTSCVTPSDLKTNLVIGLLTVPGHLDFMVVELQHVPHHADIDLVILNQEDAQWGDLGPLLLHLGRLTEIGHVKIRDLRWGLEIMSAAGLGAISGQGWRVGLVEVAGRGTIQQLNVTVYYDHLIPSDFICL